MSDTVVSAPVSRWTEDYVDRALTVLIWVLVIGLLSVSTWFGWTVYATRIQERLSTPAGRAIVDLENQVRGEPNRADFRIRLGEAYATAGLFNDALHSFEQALVIDENHTGVWLDIGLVFMAQGDNAKAEGPFQKVLEFTEGAEYEELNARREQALFYLGQIAVNDKRYEDAIGFLKGALRIRRDSSDTYYQLGHAFRGLGELDAAIENLGIAVMFDPGYAEAHFDLGTFYFENEQWAFAAVEYRKTAELAPESDLPIEALASLGPASLRLENAQSALKEGRNAEALDEVTIAVSVDPDNVVALVLRASLLEEADRKEEALQNYQRAAELDQDNNEAASGVKRLSAAD